ncbi:MAG: hypothetical protein H0W90_03715 [Actinobacteria bacterium]|nr:hypothetical protein [Actinomycetota bacterium]
MSAPAASTPAPLAAVAEKLRRAKKLVLSVRAAYVLGGLVAVQWLAVLAFAVTVRHNGWLFYSGGDQLWHYTGAYVLGHRLQPPSYVGYGWSTLLLPVTYFTGPNLVSALPVIVLFNTLVLLPVALLCIYGIAARVGGRLFGYWAAALWIALPYFGILFVEPGYHQKYTELTIPHIVGLTAMSDFPSMVGLLVSAYLCLRALESGSRVTMVAAGFAAGYAIAVKPSSAIFFFAPALLLLLTRWRTVLPFVLGFAPALATLALWKYRGLGHLGAAEPEPVRLASGVGDLLRRIHNPDANSWSHFHENLIAVREHFWVARVLEWLPVAGALALFARGRTAFWLIVPWFLAFLAIKGSYLDARMDDASFFRILLPAFPAFVLLMAAVPLLFPGWRPQPAPAPARPLLRGRRLGAVAVAICVVFAIFPVVVIAAARQVGDESHMMDYAGTLVPVRDLGLQASANGNAVQLTWNRQHVRPAKTFYVVLRTNAPGGGVTCAHVADASVDCRLEVQNSIPTRSTSLDDHPGPGTWSYRVAVSANWLNDGRLGDVYVLSEPVGITIP